MALRWNSALAVAHEGDTYLYKCSDTHKPQLSEYFTAFLVSNTLHNFMEEKKPRKILPKSSRNTVCISELNNGAAFYCTEFPQKIFRGHPPIKSGILLLPPASLGPRSEMRRKESLCARQAHVACKLCEGSAPGVLAAERQELLRIFQ